MPERVVFVRPQSSEQELCNIKEEPELEAEPTLTGEEAQAFYEDVLGLPSTSYPKPDLTAATQSSVRHRREQDSSDEEDKPGDETKSIFTKTLFSCAQNGENRQLKRLLLTKKLDVNIQDAYGWTPLHCAAVEGHISCIRTLLKFGASRELRDNKGRTPLDLARKSKNHSAYHLIKHHGASEDRQNQEDIPAPKIVTCQVCNTEYDAEKEEKHVTSIVHRAAINVVKEPLYGIPQGNVGFRMLESMGWEKERGLGPAGEGRKFPVKTVLKRDRKGLGLPAQKARVSHFDPKDPLAVKHDCEDRGEKRKMLRKKEMKAKTLEKEFRRAFY
ncbi:G patch domain and ankyrin repeat-containing protein 1 homolog [Galendromus occidentalis]|uniref:G patch domain and ankyrin repeat-containing protein 1 homolog n=1 Tax=Galendromus occidentalis TaxID=34638 RepID=A0AAJ6QVH9_9ACAR|nr:G patch domain and ankyrin repeat-containing protein 1 homolog [Galendromus occidentalis]